LADGRRSERDLVAEYFDLSVPDLDLGDHRPQVSLARLVGQLEGSIGNQVALDAGVAVTEIR
jgi:hypothetical protein